MKHILVGLAGLIFMSMSTGVAQVADTQFTADMVVKGPQGQMETGRLFVGADAVRFDRTEQGQTISRITSSADRTMRMIHHGQRSYIEFKIPDDAPAAFGRPDKPCKPGPKLACDMIGRIAVGNIQAEHWLIKPEGESKAASILFDPVRKLPLRQEFPNGVVTEAAMIGTEKYEQLNVERWEMTTRLPDGKVQKAEMLYAPRLATTVMETYANGGVRQLRNIRLAAPDGTVFQVPPGYKKTTLPQMPPNATGSTSRPRATPSGN